MFDRSPFLGQVQIRQLGQPAGTGSPGGVFGGGGSGPSGPGFSPGAPTVSVSHQNFASSPMSFDNFDFGFNDWWGYPYYNYPVYQPQPPHRMVCRKLERESENEGRDVFECVQEQPQYAAPVVQYPIVYNAPLYRRRRHWGGGFY
jgi:hypothetical protein